MKSSIKTIAFYLPQFHAIPENDEWWGNGFTEWVNVKKSQPLFSGHNQPEIPLNANYYNLLDHEVQKWQADLAKKYGIYGFCYYHYWFDGHLLLEKPMENMLSSNDIDIPFCICWANETWSRTWNGKENNVLIAQNYEESVDERKKHFDYLKPFFMDKRYIKIDNKPLFVVYKPQLFDGIDKLIVEWNSYAQEIGFDGIYWAHQHYSSFVPRIEQLFDLGIEFEPFYTVDRMFKERRDKATSDLLFRISLKLRELKRRINRMPKTYSYDEIWQHMLTRNMNHKHALGAFTSWDNTPRRGKDASVFIGSSPEKFKNYFVKQIDRAKAENEFEYIFINAWNEWAEGAHLEPDELNGYGYLEGVKTVIEE